jgi:hypothetical protein
MMADLAPERTGGPVLAFGLMAFEVQPTTVRAGHWRLSIVLVVLAVVAIVVHAVATKTSPPLLVKALSVDGATLMAQALPSKLDCHDLPRRDCETATRAALTLFSPADGSVSSAGAWKSLLCSNSIECSPRHLTPDSSPLGSVILTFGTGPAAWVNVVVRPQATAAGSIEQTPIAWLARWH